MEKKVREIIGNSLESLGLTIDSVVYEKEHNHNFLRICLDSQNIIDLNRVVEATNIINPLMDKADFINEEYHLDIYGKSKGNNLKTKIKFILKKKLKKGRLPLTPN